MPAFSIILSFFNAEGTLPQTLDSLRTRTDAEWEALRVDDGSSDGTDGVFGRVAFWRGDGTERMRQSTLPRRPLAVALLMAENAVCTMSNMAPRRDLALHVPMDEALTHNEDLDWLIRLAGSGARIVPDDRLHVLYRTSRAWTLVQCRPHARRRFVKRLEKDGSPIAEDALRQIAELNAVERSMRGMAPEARLAARHEFSTPIIGAFHPWLGAQLSRTPR